MEMYTAYPFKSSADKCFSQTESNPAESVHIYAHPSVGQFVPPFVPHPFLPPSMCPTFCPSPGSIPPPTVASHSLRQPIHPSIQLSTHCSFLPPIGHDIRHFVWFLIPSFILLCIRSLRPSVDVLNPHISHLCLFVYIHMSVNLSIP